MLRNTMFLSTIAGLIFGIVFVWQGAADAALVLLFAFIGWLAGFAVLLISRVVSGDLDPADVRSLLENVINGSSRSRS